VLPLSLIAKNSSNSRFSVAVGSSASSRTRVRKNSTGPGSAGSSNSWPNGNSPRRFLSEGEPPDVASESCCVPRLMLLSPNPTFAVPTAAPGNDTGPTATAAASEPMAVVAPPATPMIPRPTFTRPTNSFTKLVGQSSGGSHACSPNGSEKLTGSPAANPYRLRPPARPMGSSWVRHPLTALFRSYIPDARIPSTSSRSYF